MIKKRIKYLDFNDVEREEDFYFNISKSELSKAQLSVEGGLDAKLQKIADSKSVTEIAKLYEEFIDMSYGVKSDDGKHFKKDEELLEDFKSTAAYDQLYMELISSTKAAVEFIKGVLPADITQAIMNDEKVKQLTAAEN